MTTVIVILLIVVLLVAALRLWSTANRLDRLHVRTEAAWVALEGAMSRRIVATRAVAAAGGLELTQAEELRRLADAADHIDRAHRADAENDLSRALSTVNSVSELDLAAELADASERMLLARHFYNDAVRDTRALRAVLFTRIFGLAGRAALPEYFEIAEYTHTPTRVSRTAARVVLLDDHDRVLLLSGTDPDIAFSWWITPGGGVTGDEDLLVTATRELAEETGIQLTGDQLVGPLWRRKARFTFIGVDYEQAEFYYVARLPDPDSRLDSGPRSPGSDREEFGSTPGRVSSGHELNGTTAEDGHFDGQLTTTGQAGARATAMTRLTTMVADEPRGPAIDTSRHTAVERKTLTGHRWWSAEALAVTDEHVYPTQLANLLPEAVTAARTGIVPDSVPEVD